MSTFAMRRLEIARTLIKSAPLMLTVCISLNAQRPSPSPADEVKTGTITGTVVDESGQPLIGATVSIRPAGPSITGRTASTNSEGKFQVTGLDNSLYLISAISPAYIATPRDVETPARTYRVGDTVRLELIRGGVITGTVTNATGEPMTGIRVRAFMVRDATGKSANGAVYSIGERTTDDRGIYRIYGLAPGSYLVQAGGGGLQPNVSVTDLDAPTFAPSSTRDNASEIQLRSGEEVTADIRYRAEPGHSISGTVKTQGSGSANISLSRVGDGVMPINGAFQAPQSRGFVIYGLADGEYEITGQEVSAPTASAFPDISISDPLRVTIRGADITGIELVPRPLASIAGRILLESSKLPECQNKRQPLFSETMITLFLNRKATELDQSAFLRSIMGSVLPNNDGTFLLKNVRRGQYAFSPRFFARYWYFKSMSINATTTQTSTGKQGIAVKDAARNWTAVKSGDRLTGLTITLAEGSASLRGVLTIDQDRKLPSGLNVYLVPAERDKAEDPLRYFTQDIATDGTFGFTNLPPGRYWVLAQQPPPDSPTATEKLRLPDALDTRTKIRRAAEALKTEIELKPCQNLTDYSFKLD